MFKITGAEFEKEKRHRDGNRRKDDASPAQFLTRG